MVDSGSAKSESPINLDDLDVPELRSLVEQAESKIREKQDSAKAALVAEMTERAAALGLSLNAIIAAASSKTPKERKSPIGAVKFRGPNGEEWTGRGRVPQWMSEQEKAGRSREEFRI